MKKQISDDKEKPSTHLPEKKKRFSALQIILTIYGLLYLLLIITDLSTLDNFEQIVVNLAFVLFLIGYYMVWKNEGIAGIIFIFWWIIMWFLALFIAETDRGAGVVVGLPVFILGILFIISWYRKKGAKKGGLDVDFV